MEQEKTSSRKILLLIGCLFCFLANFQRVGAIPVALMMEENPSGKGPQAVGGANFIAYVIITVFGNVFRNDSGLFFYGKAPDGHIIHPASSYAVIFGILIFFSLIGLYCAYKLPKKSDACS